MRRAGGVGGVKRGGAKVLRRARGRLAGGNLLTFSTTSGRRKYINHLSRLRRGQHHVTTELDIVCRSGQGASVQLVSAIGYCNPAGEMLFETVIDRKSTRLNSSHQIISYAVFCLKKKKII